MLNRYICQGNLTRDPEFKTSGGTDFAKFGVAVNDGFGDKEKACFWDCTAFGKTAGAIYDHLKKGDQALFEGRIELDQWTDKDGTKRSKHVLIVDRMHFCGKKDGGDAPAKERAPASARSGRGTPTTEDEIPF